MNQRGEGEPLKARVLIVEDKAVIANNLHDRLQALGYAHCEEFAFFDVDPEAFENKNHFGAQVLEFIHRR